MKIIVSRAITAWFRNQLLKFDFDLTSLWHVIVRCSWVEAHQTSQYSQMTKGDLLRNAYLVYTYWPLMLLQPGIFTHDLTTSFLFLSFQVLISLESKSTIADLHLLTGEQEQISKYIVFDFCCTSSSQSIKCSLSIWPTALSYFDVSDKQSFKQG